MNLSPALRILLSLLACTALSAREALAQTRSIGWGIEVFDSSFSGEHFTTLAAATRHTLAVRGNGTIAAFGFNGSS